MSFRTNLYNKRELEAMTKVVAYASKILDKKCGFECAVCSFRNFCKDTKDVANDLLICNNRFVKDNTHFTQAEIDKYYEDIKKESEGKK